MVWEKRGVCGVGVRAGSVVTAIGGCSAWVRAMSHTVRPEARLHSEWAVLWDRAEGAGELGVSSFPGVSDQP